MAGSEKSFVWSASDYSEGTEDDCVLAIRFGSVENAQKFKSAFETAQSSGGDDEDEVEAVAEMIKEKVKVTEEEEEGEKKE